MRYLVFGLMFGLIATMGFAQDGSVEKESEVVQVIDHLTALADDVSPEIKQYGERVVHEYTLVQYCNTFRAVGWVVFLTITSVISAITLRQSWVYLASNGSHAVHSDSNVIKAVFSAIILLFAVAFAIANCDEAIDNYIRANSPIYHLTKEMVQSLR